MQQDEPLNNVPALLKEAYKSGSNALALYYDDAGGGDEVDDIYNI